MKPLGLFQFITTILFLITFSSSGHIYYALTFLELFPDYICPPDIPNCTPRDHCNNPNKVQVDWDSSKSLHNWVDVLSLDCKFLRRLTKTKIGEDPYLIGLLGSIFFVGWTCSAIFIPRLGDLLGRKRPFLYSHGLSIPIYLGLILSKNLWFSIVLYFFLGACQEGKVIVAFVYCLEYIPWTF